MIYEIACPRLGHKEAKCVFCGKPINFSDYLYICKEHGKLYYTLPKVLRVLLPKFMVWKYIAFLQNIGATV